MTFALDMPEAQIEQLRRVAARLGISPEELARAVLADHLRRPEGDFAELASYIIEKNHALYERLA